MVVSPFLGFNFWYSSLPGHPSLLVSEEFIFSFVIISSNSTTNPQALCEKSVPAHSAGVDVLANLNVYVPA